LRLKALDRDITGLSGDWQGWWTCYQFDAAALWFGNWAEAKLSETDETTHKPLYSLDDLLGEKPLNGQMLYGAAAMDMLAQFFPTK
jgi:hypothetical protein